MKIKWNNKKYDIFLNQLKSLSDLKTKQFNERIFNTKYEVLGIKTPILKKMAKEIENDDIIDFLECTGSKYFEKVMIEGFVISRIKDKDNNLFLKYFYKFIDKIDCWALCDSCVCSFKIMKENDYSDIAYSLILDSREFYIRVGYIILLNYYIDDLHINNIISLCYKDSSYYYVNMAISWLISACFVKYKENVLEMLKSKKLNPFVQNQAISKIRDSYKVSREDKELVKSFKV